jgi:hypothetical protein
MITTLYIHCNSTPIISISPLYMLSHLHSLNSFSFYLGQDNLCPHIVTDISPLLHLPPSITHLTLCFSYPIYYYILIPLLIY